MADPRQPAVSAGSPQSAPEPMPHLFGTRVALLYSAHFLYVGLYLPYFPVWLKAQGLADWEISTVLSMSLVIRVLASGQVTSFADRRPDRSVVLTWLYFGAAIAILLYLPASSFWPILFVTLLYNFFFNPVLPLADAVALAGVRRFGADYGKIRIWGSVVFILANMGGGLLLAGFAPQAILWSLVRAMWLGAIVSLFLPRIGRRTLPSDTPADRPRLWRNPSFVVVLLSAGIAQSTHGLLYGFGSIYWQSQGYSGTMIGVFWAIGVVAEILLFQFSGSVMRRISPVALLAAGCAGAAIRWALFPYVTGDIAFLVLQCLHGLSFGAVHIATMHYIMDNVSEEHIGTAQGVGFVLGGLAMGISVFCSGPLYAALGANAWLVMSGASIVALALLACRHLVADERHAAS